MRIARSRVYLVADFEGVPLYGMSLAMGGCRKFCDFSLLPSKGHSMRTLFSIAVLLSVAAPAFADPNLLPEPESLSLLAIGAIGLLAALRRKK